jgi:hypothetical protein
VLTAKGWFSPGDRVNWRSDDSDRMTRVFLKKLMQIPSPVAC